MANIPRLVVWWRGWILSKKLANKEKERDGNINQDQLKRMYGEGGLGKPVEAASGFRELAAGRKAGEVDPRNSKRNQIAGAQQTFLLGELQEPVSMARLGRHDKTLCS